MEPQQPKHPRKKVDLSKVKTEKIVKKEPKVTLEERLAEDFSRAADKEVVVMRAVTYTRFFDKPVVIENGSRVSDGVYSTKDTYEGVPVFVALRSEFMEYYIGKKYW